MEPTPPPRLDATYPRPFLEKALAPAPTPAIRAHAQWLYWVAGLTAVNLALGQAGVSTTLALGSAFEVIVTALGREFGGVGRLVAGAVGVIVVVTYTLLGRFAVRGRVWAFGMGIGLLALDTALMFLDPPGMALGLLLRAWALYSLITGLRQRLHQLRGGGADPDA